MKRAIAVVILLALSVPLIFACAPNALRPFPYGTWENAEVGLVLDVNPPGRNTVDPFHGTFVENGEKTDVYVLFNIIHGDLWILSEFDWARWQGNRTETIIFGGSYRLRSRDRLHFRLDPFWQEQTGITNTIIFDLIEEYNVES